MDEKEPSAETAELPEEEAGAPKEAENTEASPEAAEQGENVAAPVRKSGKAWWIRTSLLFALIALSIVLLFTITDSLSEDSIKSFPALLAGIDPFWLFALIGAVAGCIVLDSAKYFYLLRISTKKNLFRASMKVMFLGKYYDGITPLGSGGQPFQIYYLHKKNAIPKGVATAVPLVMFTVSTVVFCLLAATLFLIAPKYMAEGNATITTTTLAIAWVSMIFNFLVPLIIITVSLFPKFGKKLIMFIITVLAKFRIVKHRYTVRKKYLKEVNAYRDSLKAILRRWWHFIPLAILSLGSAILGMGVPFFVIMALVDVTPSMDLFIQILCMSMLTFYAASLIPTPGNEGALEMTASLVFGTVLSAGMGGTLGWCILLWRLLTYYIYIFVGVGINIFEIIRSYVRKRRAERATQA